MPGSPFNTMGGPFNTTSSPFNTTSSPFNRNAGQAKTAKPSEQVERHLSEDQKFREWSLNGDVPDDIKRIKVCRVETVCKMRFKDGETPRMRVRNLVLPLRYEDENTPISEAFTRQVRQAFDDLREKRGLTVRFIGYTDNAPLTGSNEQTYGDQLSLSKAMALRVATAMQEKLELPASVIESDGRGASRPVASNDTALGRALNRRIEVEFWYDDPLQRLSDEPQLCPDDAKEMVTRVYQPAWGTISTLELANGQPIIPAGYAASLRRALADIADRTNARIRFIGYTKNERLDRRTASVYVDDIGLSAARARRAMDIVMKDPLLSGARSEHEGLGYVQSDDVVNSGFAQGQESFVRVQVVYDEPLPLDNYEGVEITRTTQELQPKSPYDLNVMHITVDGKPVDDLGRSSEDIQRCTDVALDNAKIKFRFDNLESKPRLAVAAYPPALAVSEVEGHPDATVVRFRMYNNYASFLERAEIRIFEQQQSLQDLPLEIVPIDEAGLAVWEPAPKILTGPERELKYLLRAYDSKGHFDETESQTLLLYHDSSPNPARQIVTKDGPSPRELLAAYGENQMVRHSIQLGSGTVTVQGSGIPADHTVWLAGREIPIDPQGNFAAEQILPDGTHTVEVAVLDNAGNGSLYLRDLEFKRSDLFYLGVADVTVSQNGAAGPIDLFQGQNAPQPYNSSLDGRLAFYVNGKLSDHWRLTASADTAEGPVHEIFSNFLDKSPDSLFRRINPEYYYPTFGDDGVVTEMAPTLGKFYVKASNGNNYAMWGNFNTNYMGNEIAQVDRGLYGANAHYGTQSTTSFGEHKFTLDGFAAQPGTLSSYEQFLGTGGSLYFLHHQDVLQGSERVRVEIRDKDSQIVTGLVNLQPNVDYNVDYLQGRILLTQPLSSVADDNQLVRTTGLSGNQAYLVVRYEYTPGLDSMNAVSGGGQGHYWVNDHLQLGLTANRNKDGDTDSNLGAADMTLRMTAKSFFKMQTGRSEGLVSQTLQSTDGGYGFQSPDDLAPTNARAGAYRADLSLGLGDFIKGQSGVFTFYKQNIDAGYSAPGQETLKDTQQFGGTLRMPLTNRLSLTAKGDQRVEVQGLETRAVELDMAYKLTERWGLSTGVRNDLRNDRSPIVPLTQEQGERTDAVAQLMFNPGAAWRAYGFVQDTVAASGGREGNDRIGLGGSYRLLKRLRIDGEASDGELGPGGKIGTSYLFSDLTTVYLNYSLDNERLDNGVQTRQGNLISGVKRKLSDSSSVYAEERYQNGGQTGLTRATGINLVTKSRWNFGASTEIGKLRDSETAATTNRKAGGVKLGYNRDKLQFTSGVEYRRDNMEQPDTTYTKTTTWLFRNTFKLQLNPDWRMLGRLDHSLSNSSLGEFYAGGYSEAVVGYAYRPVRHDRLSALVKYTYFYNVPTSDQVIGVNTAVDYIQKSHIAALDLNYDLTANWSVGGKYAYRLGEASLDSTQLNFFNNSAALSVLRLDRRFRKNWEGMAEARMLDMPNISQRRRGALATIYRRIGNNLKVGLGYNFTDFSDDMTDLRYNHKGVFFNLVGAK
jgi:flagellar motor protein MotB